MLGRVLPHPAPQHTLAVIIEVLLGCIDLHRRYVEHIFEELDAPNEFYYDSTKQQLYYFHNDTNGGC